MTRAQFDSLVQALEQKFAGRYRTLAWRTALVAAMGYAGFLAWVLAIAAVGIAAFVGALFAPPVASVLLIIVGACVLAVALWQAVEVLWLPAPASKQTALRREQAPELFALLARLRRELRMPRIHRVLLSVELNASIQRRSRLGFLGWTRNVMTLGLPLMDLLTPAEFEAVAAHECAHLSPRHGRFAAWTYRVRGTWLLLVSRLQEPPKSSFSHTVRRALGRFFHWYWQRFHAYFFVMSRWHEYEADRCAAEWSGVEPAAAALWKIDVCSRRLDQRFWPELWRESTAEAQPPSDVSRRLLVFLAGPAEGHDADRWRQAAAQHITDNSDTHPCLSDRLAAFGGTLPRGEGGMPRPPSPSAAQAFLGTRLDELRGQADAVWREEAMPAWRARHGRAASIQRRLRDVEQTNSPTAAAGAAAVSTLWERAAAALELDGPAAAEPLLREVLASRPTHGMANLALGRALLERGNEEGATYLRRVLVEPDNALIPDACQTLARYFQTTGQADQMRAVYDELSLFQLAQSEGDGVSARDAFAAADLTPAELQALQSVLAADRQLQEAHLARKLLRHPSQRPLFVLCVGTRRGLFAGLSAERDAELVGRLIPRVRLPGSVLVISPHRQFRALGRKIKATPGSRIDVSAVDGAARPR
jgi:Zn-dependent protease with chaperone function